jgi:uncharacterized phage-associated protein
MSYSAKAIANYFIGKSKTDPKTSLTPLKLIKLVYIAHGFHLALTNKPLIEEYAEAWRYGPVISSLYQEFKKFGNNPVIQFAENTDEIPSHDEYTLSLLNKIWDQYGELDGARLSSWTHEDSSPWFRTWKSQKLLS